MGVIITGQVRTWDSSSETSVLFNSCQQLSVVLDPWQPHALSLQLARVLDRVSQLQTKAPAVTVVSSIIQRHVSLSRNGPGW